MTPSDLTRLVAAGEGLTLEFKKKVPRPEKLARELIALANTHGGRLLVGVDDDGTIGGLKDGIEEEYALRDAIAAHIDPPIAFGTERVALSNRREVLVVRVPASPDRPHVLVGVGEGDGTAYVRVGASSVEASKEAVRLMRRRAQDAAGVHFEFGDKEALLMRYLDEYGRVTVDAFARAAGIPLRQASHTLVLLTRAGLLRHHLGHPDDHFTRAYDEAVPVARRAA